MATPWDVRRYRVQIRRNLAWPVKPEAEQIDGKVYGFYLGWSIEEEDRPFTIYPGENAMVASDPDYPRDAPLWIASGDLVEVEEKP